MTREQRAKQFMPFDAMKGLQEALRDREERHARVERHGISGEEQEALSAALNRISKGDKIRISYYCRFHDVEKTGNVTAVNYAYRFLKVDEEKIVFDDIYGITMIDTLI